MSFSRFFRGFRLPGVSQEGNQSFLDQFTDGCLLLVSFLLPFWFLPFTIDPLDINKQTLFVGLTLLALVAWVGRGALTGSFSFIQSSLSLVTLLFLAGYGVVAWFSQDRYASFVGIPGQMHWSFVTMAAFVVFAFLVANRFRAGERILFFLHCFLLGGALASLYGVLQLFGLPILPGMWSERTFNTIGTVSALAFFCVMLMTLAFALLFLREGKRSRWWTGVYAVILLSGVLVLLATDHAAAWIALLLSLSVAVGLPFLARRRVSRPVLFVIPAILALVSVAFLWFPSPFATQVPAEVSPSTRVTWEIAWKTLRDQPITGSGPGTWALDYALHRPIDVNASSFWSILFEQGRSTALTLVATMGVVGMTVTFLLLLFTLLQSVPRVVRISDASSWDVQAIIFIGWASTVFLAFFGSHSFVHQFGFWLLFGLLMGLLARDVRMWTRTQAPRAMAGLSAASLLLVVAAVALVWLGTQRYVAEVVYAQASHMAASSPDAPPSDAVIAGFTQASTLNPFMDRYARVLAQVHLAAAGALLTSGSQDQAAVAQAHIASAFQNADAAIARNPTNGVNWAHAAGVYASLVHVVPDADTEAIRRYQEALARQPGQPAYLNAIGQAFLFRADYIQQALESLAPEQRSQAEASQMTALQNAEGAFMQALQAKPDFLPARVNLATVYGRTGRFDEAIALLTEIVEQVPDAVSVRWILADVYAHAEKYDKALAELQILADANPEDTAITERMEQVRTLQQEAAELPTAADPAIMSP